MKKQQVLTGMAIGAAVVAGLYAVSGTPAKADGEVNVYSYRQPFLVKPLFEAFEKKTGTKVNVSSPRKA